jgi:hypothetical protein
MAMRQISTSDLRLSRNLEWLAGQTLRHGVGCAVLLLRPGMGGGEPGGGAALPTLEALARWVRPLLRHSDHLAVQAGLGLGIVLHDAGEPGARLVLERLRQALAPRPEVEGATPGMTAATELAIGLATAEPTAPVRVPAVARELCARASVPDPALAFALGALTPQAVAPAVARLRRVSQRHRLARHTRATHAPSAMLPAAPGGDELERLRAQADALGVPYVTLPVCLPASVAPLLAPDLLREVRAAPLGRTRHTLTVAMDDPTDRAAIARLRAATGLAIFPVLASAGDLARTLR